MSKHILVVMTNAVPGREEEFNDWYSNTHVQEVVDIDGFVSAQRFKLSEDQAGPRNEYEYLAIYEIEAATPGEALENLKNAKPHLNTTDAIAEKRALYAYTQLTHKVVSGT